MKYDRVLIYTKKGNLMQYLNTGRVARMYSNANRSGLEQYYSQEREIQLVVSIRWEPVSKSWQRQVLLPYQVSCQPSACQGRI